MAKTVAKLTKFEKSKKAQAKAVAKLNKARGLPPAAKAPKKTEPKVKLAVVPAKNTPSKGLPLKGDKKSEKLELKATEVTGVKTEDEEEEELEKTGAAGAGAASGLAMAAATADSAAAGSLKNFRHHPDIENFYRFIFENDLRYDALEIIDVIVSQRGTKQAVKVAKAKAH